MKKIIITVIFLSSITAYAQKKKEKYTDDVYGVPVEDIKGLQIKPFKGATKVVAIYPIVGDSLFRFISKRLVADGYTIDKMQPEFGIITTVTKPVRQISYKMRLHVEDSTIKVTSEYISSIGVQIGYVKTEPMYEPLVYRSKIYVTREAFDEIVAFLENADAQRILYSK